MVEFMMAHPYLTTLIAIVACLCVTWLAMLVFVWVFVDGDIRRQIKERRAKKYDEAANQSDVTHDNNDARQVVTPNSVGKLVFEIGEFDQLMKQLGIENVFMEIDKETGLEVETPLTDYLLRESARKQGDNP